MAIKKDKVGKIYYVNGVYLIFLIATFEDMRIARFNSCSTQESWLGGFKIQDKVFSNPPYSIKDKLRSLCLKILFLMDGYKMLFICLLYLSTLDGFYFKKKKSDILLMMCDLYFEKKMFCLFKVKSNAIFIVMI